MQAEDILTATRKLEKTGMTRSQSEAIAETIVTAIAPLATKAGLDSLRNDTKTGMESIKEQMATKKDVESVKLWLLTGLLGLAGSMLAVAAGFVVYSFRLGVGG